MSVGGAGVGVSVGGTGVDVGRLVGSWVDKVGMAVIVGTSVATAFCVGAGVAVTTFVSPTTTGSGIGISSPFGGGIR